MIYSIQLINKYANKHIASNTHIPSAHSHNKPKFYNFPSNEINQNIITSTNINSYNQMYNIYWPPLIKHSLVFKYNSISYPGIKYCKKSC